MSLTKKDYKKKLEELEIDFDDNATKADLKEMYEGAIEQNQDQELKDNPDDVVNDDSEVEETKETSNQASLNDCIRQLHGKKPLACEGEDKE